MGRLVGNGARAEAEDAAADVGEREGDARAEAVEDLAVGVAGGARGEQDGVPGAGGVADAELAQYLLAQPTRGQILARARGLARLPEGALVVGGGALEQAVAAHALLLGLGVLGLAFELDTVALGEQLERALEVNALGLLDEREE